MLLSTITNAPPPSCVQVPAAQVAGVLQDATQVVAHYNTLTATDFRHGPVAAIPMAPAGLAVPILMNHHCAAAKGMAIGKIADPGISCPIISGQSGGVYLCTITTQHVGFRMETDVYRRR